MSDIITPPHTIDPAKVQLAINKLNEFKNSNEKLYRELMKFSVDGGFDAVYTEMIKRSLLP
jgi:hypothetical protein